MDLGLLGRGIIIGFAIAAPVGPIGLLCIRRTLAEGRAIGFLSGLGAATADATYGSIAAFGLSALATMLVSIQWWMRLVGTIFLLYLGIRTMLERPAEKAAPLTGRGLAGAYATTFALTITNPLTILSFAAVFAGLGAGAAGISGATFTVLGVFIGSALWWFLLSGGVGFFRKHLTSTTLRWVNIIAGLLMVGVGIWLGLGMLKN